MRESRPNLVTFDQLQEDAVRAKHHLDAERWRAELRPQALRSFAARTTRLAWSRALVKAIVEELYPDGLFAALVRDLDRVPRDRWPQVVAIAVALRHSWRRDDQIEHDETRGRTPARLVLIDAMELAWQRAKYTGHNHLIRAADPGLFGLNTLQHWLWQRLQAPVAAPVAA